MKKKKKSPYSTAEFLRLIGMLVSLAVAFLLTMFFEPFQIVCTPLTMPLSLILFAVIALILLYKTKRNAVAGKTRWFLLLTGYSVIGFVVSIVLHNAIYGIITLLTADRHPADAEIIFFLIAVFVTPILFLIGSIGSLILLSGREGRSNPR